MGQVCPQTLAKKSWARGSSNHQRTFNKKISHPQFQKRRQEPPCCPRGLQQPHSLEVPHRKRVLALLLESLWDDGVAPSCSYCSLWAPLYCPSSTQVTALIPFHKFIAEFYHKYHLANYCIRKNNQSFLFSSSAHYGWSQRRAPSSVAWAQAVM